MTVQVITGDCRDVLATMADETVHCIITSPPYFRQRDYGVAGQIGQEPAPADLADALVEVFAQARRVLHRDGAFWLNMGDTYAAGGNGGGGNLVAKRRQWTETHARKGWRRQADGFKQKDITLTPFVVADALRADGWYLRSVIIWDKIVATEPPRLDRPSTAHEYLFLLAKSEHYSVRDPGEPWFKSTVWAVRPGNSDVDHPALMSPEIVRRCLVSSSAEGDVILDPFGGAGTTGLVADRFNRNAVLIELNPAYADLARNRIAADAGMFGEVA